MDLELTAPPGFDSPAHFRERLTVALSVLEEQAAVALAAQGGTFLGRARILAQKPTAQPASTEPRGQLRPTVAGRDKWKRIEALSRLREFLTAYRMAWQSMREGVRDVVFPSGTYGLRVILGVRCTAPA